MNTARAHGIEGKSWSETWMSLTLALWKCHYAWSESWNDCGASVVWWGVLGGSGDLTGHAGWCLGNCSLTMGLLISCQWDECKLTGMAKVWRLLCVPPTNLGWSILEGVCVCSALYWRTDISLCVLSQELCWEGGGGIANIVGIIPRAHELSSTDHKLDYQQN